MQTAPKLTTHEQKQVAVFVMAVQLRESILRDALADPRISGALITVYRYLLTS